MFVDFCETRQSVKSPSVEVDSVYHLQADNSYQVWHPPLPFGKMVLLLVKDGKGYFKNQMDEFELKQGEAMVICPDKGEFYYQTVGDIWEFWWFEFYSDTLFWETGRCFQVKQDFLLERQCKVCLRFLQQGKANHASSALAGILAELACQIGQIQQSDEKKELFYRAQRMIHEKLAEITVAQVAAEIGIGERELRTLFWKQAGCSPKKYLMSEKLELACFLLKNTNKSIGEISEELGFSSQFHFSRIFKEDFGISPTIWRKR